MEFLGVSPLGDSYQYVIKINYKFKKKNKREFMPVNPPYKNHGKSIPSSENKGKS